MTPEEELRQIGNVVDRLAVRHANVRRENVERAVHDAYARFTGRRVRDFVPLLVERSAREAITAS